MSELYPSIYKGSVYDNQDPSHHGRLRVLIPQILGTSPSGWAEPTLTTRDLANHPVGSPVWVLFEGGDINYPTYIARLLVTNNDIAAGAITAETIAADAITTRELYAEAITAKHTIIGSIIETATSGERLVMRNDGSGGILESFSGVPGEISPGALDPSGWPDGAGGFYPTMSLYPSVASGTYRSNLLLLSTSAAGSGPATGYGGVAQMVAQSIILIANFITLTGVVSVTGSLSASGDLVAGGSVFGVNVIASDIVSTPSLAVTTSAVLPASGTVDTDATPISGTRMQSVTDTTDASGFLTVNFPFSFPSAPVVVACGGGNELVTIASGTVTTTGFTVFVRNAVSLAVAASTSVQINYVAGLDR